jgi:competence protein ComEA
MLGRRKPPRAASAAVAQRRLAALEATFPARGRPDPRRDEPAPIHADDADYAHYAHDDVDADDRWQRLDDPPPRAGGRHAAPAALAPVRTLALTAQQVTLLALAVAAVVALAAWWVIRAAPHSEQVQLAQERVLPPLSASASAAASDAPEPPIAQPSASSASAGSVVVDVAGKVRRPGIVELPTGSRVVDALRAAGGARQGVDTSSLNLARVLVDGEQIVIGVDVPAVPPTSASSGSEASAITPVDINTASLEQLDTLPGIGPVTAQAILDWRTENGSFTSVDELLEVSGIGDATLADIEAYVYV